MNILKNLFIKQLSQKQKAFPDKKVLVLEGGGMRGIFLTGVLQAFTDRLYFPFKLVIGSSAGALTGATYAVNQIHLARDAFFTKLIHGEFIHLANVMKAEKHVLDIDWMVDYIIKGVEPLDTEKLRKSIPVIITATDCPPGKAPKTVYLSTKKDDIPTALKATAAIPVLYRGFVQYKNYSLLDGGLLDPIPFKKALDMGYREEDILVVTTRPRGYRKKEESFWIRRIYESYYRDSKYKELVETIDNRYILYNNVLDSLENEYASIDCIYPPPEFRVSRLTRDDKTILGGFEQGVDAAKVFLL